MSASDQPPVPTPSTSDVSVPPAVAVATVTIAAASQPKSGNGISGDKTTNLSRTGSAVVIAAIVLAIYYVGVWAQFAANNSWLWTLGLLIALCIYLGWLISGRPLGILVSDRNLMSLSRFQMIAWSVVILSGFLTIAFRRIAARVASPLDIGMDAHLWALMGISTASLVGTPLILQNKRDKPTDPDAVVKAAVTLKENPQEVEDNRQGNLYANNSIKDARVTDLFEGDEVGNTAYVDIAKVQMFLFTIIIIVAFCYQLYDGFSRLGTSLDPKTMTEVAVMPVLSQGLITLLGISHVGYLGSKTADHTPTAPPNS